MRILYTIGIYLYTLGVRLAALLGHKNAGLMVKGWREFGIRNSEFGDVRMQHNNSELKTQNSKLAWFHAASLGEFEQARPVLEAFRERHPEYKVRGTFFSPSGYEVRKNYAGADRVCYLPMDTPRNVRRFLDTYRPDMAFFVKYEFWFNYLGELKKRGIPTYIFSAIFRENQYFFKWYGGWFRKQLKTSFTHLFVQNEESLHLLQGIGIEHCSLAGDTRFDRVHQIALAAEGDEVVERWLDGYDSHVLVAGSTWPPDEALLSKVTEVLSNKVTKSHSATQPLSHSATPILRIILAPHVIGEEHLRQIERLFPDSVRYSKVTELLSNKVTESHSATQPLSHSATPQVLIIDNIGMLSKLYRYATVAYIGGGFGVGIHNILEAVTFGKPVFFGPNYHKFQEAHDIIARGGGWSIRGEYDMEEGDFKRLMTDDKALHTASQACTDYMNENLGSTEKILKEIENEK